MKLELLELQRDRERERDRREKKQFQSWSDPRTRPPRGRPRRIEIKKKEAERRSRVEVGHLCLQLLYFRGELVGQRSRGCRLLLSLVIQGLSHLLEVEYFMIWRGHLAHFSRVHGSGKINVRQQANKKKEKEKKEGNREKGKTILEVHTYIRFTKRKANERKKEKKEKKERKKEREEEKKKKREEELWGFEIQNKRTCLTLPE